MLRIVTSMTQQRTFPENVSSPTSRPTKYVFDQGRFWARVDKTATCWLWTGAKRHEQYGYLRVYVDGKRLSTGAHRVAYELLVGEIPNGALIDHLCHVTACVNPAHLRVATAKQNQEHRKGAQANSGTGVRGVSWHRGAGKWEAQVTHNQRKKYLGLFTSVEDATAAVTAYRNEVFTRNDKDRREA